MVRFPDPAPFACDPEQSRGRLHAEPEASRRSPFQRDRDRIVHCAAFRRLKYKTQVFVYHEGEAYRTRLTHSLEVAQIARSIARSLGLNEDLAEALALVHDLGHPPFGHAGEAALQDRMVAHGGFDHNAQTLRIVTELEERYAAFDGLNLTWETLEGLVKHNGPLIGPDRDPNRIPRSILNYDRQHGLDLDSQPSAEAQVAALADDIAYNNHDLYDGVRAGLFGLDALRDLPLVGPALHEVEGLHPGLDIKRLIYETVRRVIDAMVTDVLVEAARRIDAQKPQHVDEVRAASVPLVAFSEAMAANDRALKGFLFPNMYRHYRVNRMTSKVRRMLGDMVDLLMAEPNLLPTAWQRPDKLATESGKARLVCDYVAGMTDRYAMEEHARLFDLAVKP